MHKQGAREGSRAESNLPRPQLQPEQLDCGAAHLQHPLTILQPLRASPVFRAPGLTAVAVASANNYTAVFLGTATGRLLKVSALPGAPREGQSRSVLEGGPGLSDVCFPISPPACGFGTFAVRMLPPGLCFPTGCSCWGTAAGLVTTSGVQFLY